jgi:hypothetical protein
MPGDSLRTTDYGFEWGPLRVSRTFEIPGEGRVVTIEPSEAEKARRRSWTSLSIWWSEGGRSVRVHSRRVKRVRYPRNHPFAAGQEGHRVVSMSEWAPKAD